MPLPAAGASDHAVAAAIPQPRPHVILNINPASGLSTDYLNHFAEAIMVLEMATTMPDCLDDLRAWRPKTYCEHFASSRFSNREALIAAYEAADPAVRKALDAVSKTLNIVLAETRDMIFQHPAKADANMLVQRTLSRLKPLIARAAAVINGGADARPVGTNGVQAAIDALFSK